ncbi:hypothetical protein E0K89_000020 [Aquicoccus sp. SCR17]|nr:hypothetical protein [Carideicomes alvinocaridis]
MTREIEIDEARPDRRREAVGLAVFRTISTIFGSLLLAAALGLWILPGSNWSVELLLVKAGLTGLFGLGGVSFLQSARLRRG